MTSGRWCSAAVVKRSKRLTTCSSVAVGSELDNSSAVALRGTALGRGVEHLPRPALLYGFHAQRAAGFRFLVERLSYSGGPAHLAEQQNFHFKIAALSPNVQEFAQSNLAGRLDRLLVGLNPAQFAGPGRQAACLEKSGSPQPLIHANAGH